MANVKRSIVRSFKMPDKTWKEFVKDPAERKGMNCSEYIKYALIQAYKLSNS